MLKRALAMGTILLCSSAWSADAHFEWGLGVGASKVTVQDRSLNLDFKSNGFAFAPFVGYQFMRFVAVEGGYIAGGKSRDRTGNNTQIVKSDGWTLSGVGMWPINETYSIYGRLGGVLWDSKSTEFIVGAPKTSGSSSSALFGLGAGYVASDTIKLRLEYQRSNIDGGSWQAVTLGFVAYL